MWPLLPPSTTIHRLVLFGALLLLPSLPPSLPHWPGFVPFPPSLPPSLPPAFPKRSHAWINSLLMPGSLEAWPASESKKGRREGGREGGRVSGRNTPKTPKP